MSADTRQRILETARKLFHEQGYHATGIATILREAGVNSGSLYYFFDSKEALLVGVLEYYIELLMPVILGPAEAITADPIERVFAMLANYREGLVHSGCTMGCPIGNLALEVADDNPAARALIHQNFRNWIAGVQRWLDAAGDRLPPDVDRAELAEMVLTVMEGGMMQSRASRTLAPFDHAVSQLRAYFERLTATAGGTAADGRAVSTPNSVAGGNAAPACATRATTG